eukprot:scaffold21302_cov50-Phaeocystis_antarctica.AAC.3
MMSREASVQASKYVRRQGHQDFRCIPGESRDEIEGLKPADVWHAQTTTLTKANNMNTTKTLLSTTLPPHALPEHPRARLRLAEHPRPHLPQVLAPARDVGVGRSVERHRLEGARRNLLYDLA